MIGKADIVESVVGVLDEKKKGWEADAEDRKLRNYTETIEVDPIFHSKIIGYKVNKMTHIATILKDSDDSKNRFVELGPLTICVADIV